MKVLKPFVHVEITEKQKSVIIVENKINLQNKEVKVIEAHSESILKKGDTLVLKPNVGIQGYKIEDKELLFIDERDILAAF
jgi:co-chaperonin GroES (HSP10)